MERTKHVGVWIRCSHRSRHAVVASALGCAALGRDGLASDHQEAPAMGAPDAAADLGDLYAWHTDDALVIVATYAGYAPPAADPTYDGDVLYELHLDRDGDRIADASVDVRFGRNDAGQWAVRFANVPGEREPIEGEVDRVLDGDGGARVFAGQRDDPFFFDLEGFGDTVATGALAFDATRDFAAFQNTNAIVVEIPLAAALDGSASLSVWATTGRRAG